MSLRRRSFLKSAAASVLAAPALSRATLAQGYPNRVVRVIVATAAGGTADILARVICQWLSEKMGQSFIVENRTGGAGNIAVETARQAPPDGYTLHFSGPVNAINASLYDRINYLEVIEPVAALAQAPHVVEVRPDFPAKTIPELIAYAKANPGKVNYGSAGIGTSNHVAVELFNMMAGTDMVHVPYRGTSPAIMDLFAGSIQVVFDILPSSIEYIRAKKLTALGLTGPGRMDALPGVPAVTEFLPGYEASAWFGFGVPKATPRDIIDALNKATNAAFNDSAMQAKLAEFGSIPMPGTPEDFAKFIASEIDKWGKVIRFANIKPQ